jgi:O-antigen/teichoic acid export membrane protein
MGEAQGGNTVEDITTVIRVSSLSLVFVSILSIMKGYLQGHKYITVTSISQVIEQVVRVAVIIVGSYLALNVWHLGLTNAVSVAVFGACAGAIVAIIYLWLKMHKAKELKVPDYKESKEEQAITHKGMLKQLVFYALPFMMIAFMTSGYEMIDMFTVGPTLRSLGFSTTVSEAIVSDMTTWGSKLMSIIQAVVSGFCISLIPHIASSYAKNDMEDVDKKINKTYQMTAFLVIPMSIGLSLLAQPVWQTFYGITEYGPKVFMFLILSEIPAAIFLVSLVILQALNMHKEVFIALLVGLIYNAGMNIPSMNFCYIMGLPAYYGATLASIVGYILSILIALYSLKKKHNINFKQTSKIIWHIILANLVMLGSLLLLNLIIPINVSTRAMSVVIIIIYALIGSIIYGVITYKSHLMENIFGKEEVNKILKHIPIVKKYVKE